MQGGELGTEPELRCLWVLEGAVAYLPAGAPMHVREQVLRRRNKWDQAAGMWVIHTAIVTVMWQLWRAGYRSDVIVTTREQEFAQAMAERFTIEGSPVRYVSAMPAEILGRRLAPQPDVVRVFYGLERQSFAYGPKGYHVPFGGVGFEPLI